MALPPCHVFYQFLVNEERKELNLCMTQRSADVYLGLPFNTASSALLLSLMAHWAGYRPRHLTLFLGDAHIYVNHLDQVREQLGRQPFDLPRLKIDDRVPVWDGKAPPAALIDAVEPDSFSLLDYHHGGFLPAPMAV